MTATTKSERQVRSDFHNAQRTVAHEIVARSLKQRTVLHEATGTTQVEYDSSTYETTRVGAAHLLVDVFYGMSVRLLDIEDHYPELLTPMKNVLNQTEKEQRLEPHQ